MSLHESLRIYVPGLLLSLLWYALLRGTLSDSGIMAVPAIFVGFAVNVPFMMLQKRYFNYLVRRHMFCLNSVFKTYDEIADSILSAKYELLKVDMKYGHLQEFKPSTLVGWTFIEQSYFAKNYDSAETLGFRLPKSFGVMCFNLFLSGLTAPLIFLIVLPLLGTKLTAWHISVLSASLVFSLLFLVSSKEFLKSSLLKELYYWGSMSKDDMDKLVQICLVQDKL